MALDAEVFQAGLEARYYVRGAMDPAYATPEARDAYVKTLYPEQAAAFLRGWVEHHPEDRWPELSGVFCGEPYHTPMDQSAYLWSRSQ